MTTDPLETQSEYIRRMADDGGGGLATPSEVEANLDASFEDLAIVVETVGELPATATIRASGVFTNANDGMEYLQSGGLVVTDGPDTTAPIGWVYVLKQFDDILQEYTWTVYIDSES